MFVQKEKDPNFDRLTLFYQCEFSSMWSEIMAFRFFDDWVLQICQLPQLLTDIRAFCMKHDENVGQLVNKVFTTTNVYQDKWECVCINISINTKNKNHLH